jgi:hypothetical protein
LSLSWPRALASSSPPAAAAPDIVLSVLDDELLPEAALWSLLEPEALGVCALPEALAPLVVVDGEVELAVPEGEVALLVLEGELLPLAALEPEPVVEDWLVCALWSIDEDEFTSVELWLADTPLDTLWSPLPTFTPGLMLAPALMSVLLMPTFASTPTFGSTFTPVLDEDEGGVAVVDDCEVWALWSSVLSVLDCAHAGPNAPITAAAVILTARCLALIIYTPFTKMMS